MFLYLLIFFYRGIIIVYRKSLFQQFSCFMEVGYCPCLLCGFDLCKFFVKGMVIQLKANCAVSLCLAKMLICFLVWSVCRNLWNAGSTMNWKIILIVLLWLLCESSCFVKFRTFTFCNFSFTFFTRIVLCNQKLWE